MKKKSILKPRFSRDEEFERNVLEKARCNDKRPSNGTNGGLSFKKVADGINFQRVPFKYRNFTKY